MPEVERGLKLEDRIEAGRMQMMNLATQKGRHHVEVIEISQELDKLITVYYQK